MSPLSLETLNPVEPSKEIVTTECLMQSEGGKMEYWVEYAGIKWWKVQAQ
jgi:hypothetical protein